MFFQITTLSQLLGWVLVFVGLILLNEIGRRTLSTSDTALLTRRQ